MIKRHHLIFGPGGNSESFYAQGHKRTVETFAWQKQFGLKAFEYSFGRGINISKSTARGIGQAAKASGVTLSVHAPYYINLASNVPETRKKSIEYIRNSARLLNLMGGKRLVVHPGSPLRQRREEALARCAQALVQARTALIEDGHAAVSLALETMGRPSQIGTLQEILDFVLLDLSFLPVLTLPTFMQHPAAVLGRRRISQMCWTKWKPGSALSGQSGCTYIFQKLNTVPKANSAIVFFQMRALGRTSRLWRVYWSSGIIGPPSSVRAAAPWRRTLPKCYGWRTRFSRIDSSTSFRMVEDLSALA